MDINLLENQDWDYINLALVNYVIFKAKRYGWNVNASGRLPNGMAPYDVALESIKKIFTGEREWDNRSKPDLLLHLKSIVNSLLYHIYISWINKYVIRCEDEIIESYTFDKQDPENMYKDRIRQEAMGEIVEQLRAAMQNKPELQDVMEAIIEGCEKPRQIAKRLKVEVEEIYYRIKRMRRIALKMNFEIKCFQQI